MSLPGADPTPAEALEWALDATPGAAEEFARAEVARLRAIEAKYAQFAAIVADLDMDHHAYCPRLGLSADVPATTSATRCRCDLNARAALQKLAES